MFFGVLNWCDYNEFWVNCCFKKAGSTLSSWSFYEQVCNGSDWEYTLKDKDSADGWLDSRCSEENVPVSSPNVTALSNFRDRVTRAVIDRLSWPLHPLFYGWPSERSQPRWNTVSLELCLHTVNLSWSCGEGLRRVHAQRVCLF